MEIGSLLVQSEKCNGAGWEQRKEGGVCGCQGQVRQGECPTTLHDDRYSLIWDDLQQLCGASDEKINK